MDTHRPIIEQIRRAAETLRRYGAREVYLFGSRETERETDASDVDLAVKGLPDEVYIRAIAQASLDISVPLDVVSLDDDTPFVRHLLDKGDLRRVA